MQKTGGKLLLKKHFSIFYSLIFLIGSACGPVSPSPMGTPTHVPAVPETATVDPTPILPTTQPDIPTPTDTGTTTPQPAELARSGMGVVYQQLLSPDDSALVLGTATGIYVYDTATMQLTTRLGKDGVPAKYLLFSPNGKYLAVAPSYVQVDVYDFASRKILFTLGADQIDPEKKNPDGPFFAFSPEESLFYFFMSANQNIEVHTLPNGMKADTWSPELYENHANIYVSNDGKTLICITSKNSKILDIKNGRDINPYIHDVSFKLGEYTISNDRSKLITFNNNSTDIIQLSKYDGPHITNSITPENYPEISFPMDGNLFLKADISPNSNHAAFLTPDHRICLWSIPAMARRSCLPKPGGGYTYFKFSPDSSWLLAVTNSEIQSWEMDWYSKEWTKRAWITIQNPVEDAVFSRKGDFAIVREYTQQDGEYVLNKRVMSSPGFGYANIFAITGSIQTSQFINDESLALKNTLKEPGTLSPTDTANTPAPTNAMTNLAWPAEIARWGMGNVYQQILSPDDRTLVLGTATGIYLYDTTTMQLSSRLGKDGIPAKYLMFSPGGKYLAVAPSYVQVDVYDFANRELLYTLGADQSDEEKITPDGPFFAFAQDESRFYFYKRNNRNIEVFNFPDWKKVETWPVALSGNDARLFLSKDGRLLIGISSSSGWMVDAKTGDVIDNYFSLGWFQQGNYAISDDHTEFITNSYEKTTINLFQLNGQVTTTEVTSKNFPEISFPVERELFKKIEISPDGHFAALLTLNNEVCIWNFSTMGRVKCLPDEDKYTVFKFSPDSLLLLAVSKSQTQLWETISWKTLVSVPTLYMTEDVIFSHNGEFALTKEFSPELQGAEQVVNKRLLNPPDYSENQLFNIAGTIHTSRLQGNTFLSLSDFRNPILANFKEGIDSPILTLGSENVMTWVIPETGVFLSAAQISSSSTRMASSPDLRISAFTYNPGGQLILSAADLNNQFQSGTSLRTLAMNGLDWQECKSLSVSNSGLVAASIASGKGDAYMVGIWSLKDGTLVGQIPLDSHAVAISSDGSKLAVQFSAGADRITIYDIQSVDKIKEIRTIDMMGYSDLKPGSQNISALAFSPDGSRLAVGFGSTFKSYYGDIYILDTLSWKKQYTFDGNTRTITGLVFSANGEKLYSYSEDGTTRIWGPLPKNNPDVSQPVEPASKTAKGYPQQQVGEDQLVELTPENASQMQEINRWQVGLYSKEEGYCLNCAWELMPVKDKQGWGYLYSVSDSELRYLYPYSVDIIGKEFKHINNIDTSYNTAISADGKTIAVKRGANSGIDIFDGNGDFVQNVKGLSNDTSDSRLVLSRNGHFLIASSSNKELVQYSEVAIWDLDRKPAKLLKKVEVATSYSTLSLFEDESGNMILYLNTVHQDQQKSCIPFLHITSDGLAGNVEKNCNSLNEYSSDVVVSSDNKLLAVEGPYSVITIYENQTLNELAKFDAGIINYRGENVGITFGAAVFLQDRKGLLVSWQDGTIRLYGVKK